MRMVLLKWMIRRLDLRACGQHQPPRSAPQLPTVPRFEAPPQQRADCHAVQDARRHGVRHSGSAHEKPKTRGYAERKACGNCRSWQKAPELAGPTVADQARCFPPYPECQEKQFACDHADDDATSAEKTAEDRANDN